MQPLVLHPSCDPGPIERVMAGIVATSEGCRARFQIEGDLPRVILPPHAMAARTDGLWRTNGRTIMADLEAQSVVSVGDDGTGCSDTRLPQQRS